MGVGYITGRAGSGKSMLVFQQIKEYLDRDGGHQLILLVPEQFTLQSERDLIQSLQLPGIMQVEVLSFNRLADRILDEAGGKTRTLIDEQGKYMVLRKVVDELSPQLTIYQKVSRQDGFIHYIGDLLSELKQYNIALELLELTAPALPENLGNKIHDIALIYGRFNDYLGTHYLDLDDRINLVLNRMQESSFLKNSVIWLDGFTTFTPQQLDMIYRLMLMSDQINFAFTLDLNERARDRELFEPTRRAYDAVKRLADELNLGQEYVEANHAHFQRPAVMTHLERELYAFPNRVYEHEIENLTMFAASTIYQEVEEAAAEISRLAREEQMRWRDIMVVCSDMDKYGVLIRRSFQEYGIPYFIDSKHDIMTHPLVEYILSLLDMCLKNYRLIDVFRCLKTGLADLLPDQVEVLENYAIAYGIQGEQWKREFCLGQNQPLPEINQWREDFITSVILLEKRLRQSSTIAEYTGCLYEYLEEQQMLNRIDNIIKQLQKEERYELVYEHAQIWNIVMRIFDQSVDIMESQTASLSEYRRILEAGFASYQLGIIPTTVDQVLVGSVKHLKSRGVKALLVLGVNDGLLPSIPSSDGILLEEERMVLHEQGIELSGGRERRLEEERLLIYSMFSKASAKVWVSYALADGEGRAQRPSLLVDRFKRLFKQILIHSDLLSDQDQQMKMLGPPTSTIRHLTQQMRQYMDGQPIPDFWWHAMRWYQLHPDWKAVMDNTQQALFHRNQVSRITNINLQRLYPYPFRASVSRLEQFAACPFAHLVRYGMRPRERREYSVAMPDIGELFHQCLYSFSQQVTDQDLSWSDLKPDQCDQMVDTIMDSLASEYGDGVFNSSYRYRYMTERLKRMGRNTVRALVTHVQKGEFLPLAFEVRFGSGGQFPPIAVELADGKSIFLEGRVDRIDVLDEGAESFVKVIDYKTGDLNLRLEDIYHGLSLQLMVYLQAVLQHSQIIGRKNLQPAGVFYFHIDDPLVSTSEMITDKIAQELRKQFRMKGLVLRETRIIQGIDRDLPGYSEVIPASINNDGSVGKSSSGLESNEWSLVLNHVEQKVRRLGQDILDGNAAIEPYRREKDNACTYCPYHSICQFDPLFEDNQFRYLPSFNHDETLQLIRKKEVN